MTRAVTPASYSHVLAAVRRHVAEDTEPGRWYYQAHGLIQPIAAQLGIPLPRERTDWERKIRSAFNGQILRALNQLADEGILIKVGKSEKGPRGTKPYGGIPEFYTQPGWRAADEAYKSHQAEVAELSRRWTSAHDRLAGIGLSASHSRGSKWVTISLEDLEQLLDRFDAVLEEARD